MTGRFLAAGFALAIGMTVAGSASAASNCSSAFNQTGFAVYDAEAVESATDIRIVATERCYGPASSLASDPGLQGKVDRNPAYRNALRRNGYPTTDIYGVTLSGTTMTVYIHDRS